MAPISNSKINWIDDEQFLVAHEKCALYLFRKRWRRRDNNYCVKSVGDCNILSFFLWLDAYFSKLISLLFFSLRECVHHLLLLKLLCRSGWEKTGKIPEKLDIHRNRQKSFLSNFNRFDLGNFHNKIDLGVITDIFHSQNHSCYLRQNSMELKRNIHA